MAGSTYLFTGEEQYLLHQEVLRWKENFAEKFGEDSVFEFSGDRDPSEVVSSLQGGGLFSTKKLVVIWGVPQDTFSHNKVKVSSIDPVVAALDSSLITGGSSDVLLVCVSYKPDKRKTAFKWFKKHAELKTFAPLKGASLKKHVGAEAADLLTPAVLDHFLLLVGNDLWYIHNCLSILRSRHDATGKTPSESDVDRLIYPRTEANNFAFLDALFVDSHKAYRRLDESKDDGTHRTLFMGAVYWGVKIMIQMMVLYQQGKTTSSLLAKEVSAPPFTVSRYLKFIPSLSQNPTKVMILWNGLVELDYGIKTGKIPGQAFWIHMKRLISLYHK